MNNSWSYPVETDCAVVVALPDEHAIVIRTVTVAATKVTRGGAAAKAWGESARRIWDRRYGRKKTAAAKRAVLQQAHEIVATQRPLSARDILRVGNAERRRELIWLYGGIEDLMTDLLGSADPAVTDARGALYRIRQQNDEPLCFVRVRDASTDRECCACRRRCARRRKRLHGHLG
jgi:hypothetical protein